MDKHSIRFNAMLKSELGEFLNHLQSRVDSGRHTGADVQILKIALKIYIERFEGGILWK